MNTSNETAQGRRGPKPSPRNPHRTGCPRLAILLSVALLAGELLGAPADRPNVLFIVVDDFRTTLGVYGEDVVRTPNVDRLARNGLIFERAYCQIPSCSPSRSSLLTGLRPDTVRIYDNNRHFREAVPNAVTLPQYFKQHGYRTVALSKIYHGGIFGNTDDLLDPPSWSEPEWKPSGVQYVTPASLEILRQRYPQEFDGSRPLREALNGRIKGPAWEVSPLDDAMLADGETARKAAHLLGGLKAGGQPFFLAVGLVSPHAPFVVPSRYFDLVDESKIRLPAVRDLPEGSTPLAGSFREMQGYAGIPQQGVFPDQLTRELIRAYAATVAYVDAQVGLILARLDELGLADNTIIVFTSDHGYHLGEAGQWSKNTNFEEAVRVPLIVSIPGISSSGRRTEGIVELIDLYPTLAQLCRLPDPAGLEGSSFAPLFATPGREWKRAAFSQHSAVKHDPTNAVRGRSIATKHFRYVEWREPKDEKVVAEELYRIENGRTPARSLAALPEHADTLREMRRIMNEGWQRTLP